MAIMDNSFVILHGSPERIRSSVKEIVISLGLSQNDMCQTKAEPGEEVFWFHATVCKDLLWGKLALSVNRADRVDLIQRRAETAIRQSKWSSLFLALEPGEIAAVWIERSRSLVVGTNAYGGRPLYYADADGIWTLSTQLTWLMRNGVCPPPNLAEIRRYLAGYDKTRTSRTWWQGISTLVPDCYLHRTLSRETKVTRYWIPRESDTPNKSKDEWNNWVWESILESVQRILQSSSQPLAISVSGGLDSGAIAAAVHQLGAEGIVALTIGVPDSNLSEQSHAEAVARATNLPIRVVVPDSQDLWTSMSQLVATHDGPVGGPRVYSHFAMLRAAAGMGISAVLEGVGSDELLGGYPEVLAPSYLAGLALECEVNLLERDYPLWRNALRNAFQYRAAYAQFHADLYDILGVQEPIEEEDETRLPAGLTEVCKQLIGSGYMMQNCMTRRYNALPWNISVHSPFLDYECINRLVGIPPQLKMGEGVLKHILRDVLSDSLPNTVVWRTNKLNMNMPKHRWLHESKQMIHEILKSNPSGIRGVTSPELLLERFNTVLQQPSEFALWEHSIWRFLFYEAWYDRFYR